MDRKVRGARQESDVLGVEVSGEALRISVLVPGEYEVSGAGGYDAQEGRAEWPDGSSD